MKESGRGRAGWMGEWHKVKRRGRAGWIGEMGEGDMREQGWMDGGVG